MGAKVPRYLCHYPYSPLVVAKMYLTICIAVCLIMWNELKPWLRTSYFFTGMAVLDLLSLLFTLISLWFALQKFFWVKLESALTFFSLVFICLAVYCVYNIQTKLNHVELNYLTICHCYMFLVQVFTIGWTLKFTRNNVSNLFISNWGLKLTMVNCSNWTMIFDRPFYNNRLTDILAYLFWRLDHPRPMCSFPAIILPLLLPLPQKVSSCHRKAKIILQQPNSPTPNKKKKAYASNLEQTPRSIKERCLLPSVYDLQKALFFFIRNTSWAMLLLRRSNSSNKLSIFK